MNIIIGLILIAIGIVMIFKPYFFYDITEGWKHDNSIEPSDLYKFHTRLGGVMFVLAGVISFAIQFMTML